MTMGQIARASKAREAIREGAARPMGGGAEARGSSNAQRSRVPSRHNRSLHPYRCAPFDIASGPCSIIKPLNALLVRPGGLFSFEDAS